MSFTLLRFIYRQIALADIIIVNKEDLVPPEELSHLKTQIKYVDILVWKNLNECEIALE